MATNILAWIKPCHCTLAFHLCLCTCTHPAGIEIFNKSLEQGEAGDQLGALLRGIKRKDICRGMVLCQPGTMTPHSKFKAQVYVLKKEEGGRHTPFITRYKSLMFTRTASIMASMQLPEGTCMCTVLQGTAREQIFTPRACTRGKVIGRVILSLSS